MRCHGVNIQGQRCGRTTSSQNYCYQHQQTGSGRNQSVRPSPGISATLFEIGIQRLGNDGNLWKIVENIRGTKRWQKVGPSQKKKTSRKTLRKKKTSRKKKKSRKKSRKTSRKKSRKTSRKTSRKGNKSKLLVKTRCDSKIVSKIVSALEKIMSEKVKLKEINYWGTRINLDEAEKKLVILATKYLLGSLQTYNWFGNQPLYMSDEKIKTIKDLALAHEDLRELTAHFGRLGKDRFLDIYGAPGDNSMGYGIYYQAQTKTYWFIYDNSDGSIISKFCPKNKKFNQTIKKFEDWRNSHSESGTSPFHVDY